MFKLGGNPPKIRSKPKQKKQSIRLTQADHKSRPECVNSPPFCACVRPTRTCNETKANHVSNSARKFARTIITDQIIAYQMTDDDQCDSVANLRRGFAYALPNRRYSLCGVFNICQVAPMGAKAMRIGYGEGLRGVGKRGPTPAPPNGSPPSSAFALGLFWTNFSPRACDSYEARR